MGGTDRLLARWVALAGPGSESAGTDLIDRYSESQRHYHTTEHLRAVLDVVDDLSDYAKDPDTVRLAAWFHDAVYDVHVTDNEERSAQLTEEVLPTLGVDPARTAEVARLVRLTAHHGPDPDDTNGAVLCDADLAVLASPPTEYERYAAGVREEYSYVGEEEFRLGRSAVLRSLQAIPRLFHTPMAYTRYESRARRNLRDEIAALTGTARPWVGA